MADTGSFAQRWERWQQRWDDFTPSRTTWLWSCLGSAAMTVAIGFMVCGWMTRGQADLATTRAAHAARADLMKQACLWNFANGPDLAAWLASLKGAGGNTQPGLMAAQPAGITLAGLDKPPAEAASLCADDLATVHSTDVPSPQG